MPKLVISAAHTSMSPGAVFQDLREFDLTRKLLQLTIPHLRNNKIEFQAVPVDIQLLDRIKWINNTGYSEANGDIFIEIHINDGNKRGIESWFKGKDSPSNKSQKLAEFLSDEICKVSKYENQGAKSEHKHELGSLLILNQTKPISTAIEFLYIDNAEDIKILKDDKKLDELAKTFADAIKKYIDNPPKVEESKELTTAQTTPNFSIPNFGGNDPFNLGLGNDLDSTDASTAGINTTNTGTANVMMDRDQRKKMILDLYQKYLGKEPKESDIQYFLNIGISEQQLVDRIIKSQDHEALIKDAKDADTLRKESRESQAELIKLRAEVNDLKAMLHNLNQLMLHKNEQIRQMHQELINKNVIKKGEYFDPNKKTV